MRQKAAIVCSSWCAMSLGVIGCGGRLPSASSSDAAPVTVDAAAVTVDAGRSRGYAGRTRGDAASSDAPAGNRCDQTPRMLANARALQIVGAGTISAKLGDVVVGGDDLYYTAWGAAFRGGGTAAVVRVPRGGGTSMTAATASKDVGRPVVTDTAVVFTAQTNGKEDTVLMALLSGVPARAVGTFPADELSSGFAADDNFAYFGAIDGIYALPLHPDGGIASPIPITTWMPASQGLPDGLGLFGNQLIFGLSQGGLESVPLPPQANSPVTPLGAGHEAGMVVLPAGPTSRWLGWYGYDLEQIDPQGNVISTLPTASLRWNDLAFDGTSFFAVGNNPGLLYGNLVAGFLARIDVSTGTITTLGTMEDAVDVAVDDECVYWTSASGLYSLSKTATQTFALDGVPPAGAAPDAGTSVGPSADGGAYAGACTFETSNYDQSCALDGDCVSVVSGNYCTNRMCDCDGDPISIAGRTQFNADIANTPLGSGALQWPTCSCQTPAPICCRAGTCTHACNTAE
jgi:hypothetical protein